MFDILHIQKWVYHIALRLYGWKSIDTAPTDGTSVIILENMQLEYWNVFEAQYINEEPLPGWRGVYVAKYVGADETKPHYVSKTLVTIPEYWKPMPKSPRFYKLWCFACNDIQVKIEEEEEKCQHT